MTPVRSRLRARGQMINLPLRCIIFSRIIRRGLPKCLPPHLHAIHDHGEFGFHAIAASWIRSLVDELVFRSFFFLLAHLFFYR